MWMEWVKDLYMKGWALEGVPKTCWVTGKDRRRGMGKTDFRTAVGGSACTRGKSFMFIRCSHTLPLSRVSRDSLAIISGSPTAGPARWRIRSWTQCAPTSGSARATAARTAVSK